jgi:hypothetical protein
MLAGAFLEEVSKMHIVIVSIQVKDDRAGDFLTMTQRNVRETLKEPVLATPRSRTLYVSCLPHESGWE